MKRAAIEANDGRGKLPVYLFGSSGLEKILNEAGIETFGVGPDTMDKYTSDGTFLMDIDTSRRVFAVVGSFDQHISYAKIMKAVNYLKDPKVHFIVSNEDMTFPGSVPGVIVPGAGTVSCVLKAISKRQPIVVGKPHAPTFGFIADRLGNSFDRARTLMVGDRLDTDILFGNSNGLDTLLVMTGVSKFEDLDRLETEIEAISGSAKCSSGLAGAEARSGQLEATRQLMPKIWANSVADLLVGVASN